MKWLITIVSIACVTACSSPKEPTPDVGGDTSVVSQDTARDADIQGVEWFSFDPVVSQVSLEVTGDYLFVFTDQTLMRWIYIPDMRVQEVFTWPAAAFEATAGPVENGFAIGPDYVWLNGETQDGNTAFVGAEHQISEAVWLFGQPIIVIDLGPAEVFRGIGQFGDRTIAITNRFLQAPDPTIWIRESEQISRSIPLTSPVAFEKMIPTDRGPVLFLESGVLAIYDVVRGEDETLQATSEVPVAAIGRGESFVVTDGDAMFERSAADCADCEFELIAETPGATALRRNETGEIFWTDGDAVFDASGARLASAPGLLDFVVWRDVTFTAQPSGILRFDP